MKHFIILMLTGMQYFYGISLFAQRFDTTTVILRAKIPIMEYASFETSDQTFAFLQEPTPFRVLSFSGFSDYWFFFAITIEWEPQKNNHFYLHKTDFTFAFHKKSKILYKIKGFSNNDTIKFFEALYGAGGIDITKANHKYLTSKKLFSRSFFIEGVDMKCLFLQQKYWLKQRKKMAKLRCDTTARQLLD